MCRKNMDQIIKKYIKLLSEGSVLPEKVVWQANFKQGTLYFKYGDVYYGY